MSLRSKPKSFRLLWASSWSFHSRRGTSWPKRGKWVDGEKWKSSEDTFGERWKSSLAIRKSHQFILEKPKACDEDEPKKKFINCGAFKAASREEIIIPKLFPSSCCCVCVWSKLKHISAALRLRYFCLLCISVLPVCAVLGWSKATDMEVKGGWKKEKAKAREIW